MFCCGSTTPTSKVKYKKIRYFVEKLVRTFRAPVDTKIATKDPTCKQTHRIILFCAQKALPVLFYVVCLYCRRTPNSEGCTKAEPSQGLRIRTPRGCRPLSWPAVPFFINQNQRKWNFQKKQKRAGGDTQPNIGKSKRKKCTHTKTDFTKKWQMSCRPAPLK